MINGVHKAMINYQAHFLDAQASLAPTQVSPSVGHTFEFPFYQRVWLLYVKS